MPSVTPIKQLTEDGKPIKCRECGHNEFNLIEDNENRMMYECKNCQCRNVVVKEIITSIQTWKWLIYIFILAKIDLLNS